MNKSYWTYGPLSGIKTTKLGGYMQGIKRKLCLAPEPKIKPQEEVLIAFQVAPGQWTWTNADNARGVKAIHANGTLRVVAVAKRITWMRLCHTDQFEVNV